MMDYPIGVVFSASVTNTELLVITFKSRLLKFDSKSGQLLSEVRSFGGFSFVHLARGTETGNGKYKNIKMFYFQSGKGNT